MLSNIPAGAIDLGQMQQNQAAMANYVAELDLNTGMHIFARLVGDWFAANPDAPPDNAVFQNLAFKARIVAPFWSAANEMRPPYELKITNAGENGSA